MLKIGSLVIFRDSLHQVRRFNADSSACCISGPAGRHTGSDSGYAYDHERKYIGPLEDTHLTRVFVLIGDLKEFKPFAIRYNKYITEGVFNNIVGYLSTLKVTGKEYCRFNPDYKTFKNIGYLRIDDRVDEQKGRIYWCIDNNPQGLDILSSDEVLSRWGIKSEVDMPVFYTRYTSEWSKDVYDKLKDWFRSKNWYYFEHFVEEGYEIFKGNGYLRTSACESSETHVRGWCIDNNDQGLKEYSLQDVLKLIGATYDKGPEIVKEARKRYPLGTYVRSLFQPEKYCGKIVSYETGLGYVDGWDKTDERLWVKSEHGTNFIIYEKGKWAEIVKKPDKFKIGDIIVGNEKASACYGITRKGWIAKVTNVSSSHISATGFNNSTSLENAFFSVLDPTCFDLVPSDMAQLRAEFKEKSTIKEEYEPKPGDWVKITKSIENWNPAMDEYIGKIVQIEKFYPDGSVCFKNKECGGWIWRYKEKHFIPVDPPRGITISQDIKWPVSKEKKPVKRTIEPVKIITRKLNKKQIS